MARIGTGTGSGAGLETESGSETMTLQSTGQLLSLQGKLWRTGCILCLLLWVRSIEHRTVTLVVYCTKQFWVSKTWLLLAVKHLWPLTRWPSQCEQLEFHPSPFHGFELHQVLIISSTEARSCLENSPNYHRGTGSINYACFGKFMESNLWKQKQAWKNTSQLHPFYGKAICSVQGERWDRLLLENMKAKFQNLQASSTSENRNRLRSLKFNFFNIWRWYTTRYHKKNSWASAWYLTILTNIL